MSFQLVASANAVISLGTGLLALLAPATLIGLYDVAAAEREMAATQMLGASYLGFAVILWALRGAADGGTRTALAAGSLAAWGASLVVGLLWTRLAAGMAWPTVAMQALFTLAWAYLLITTRNASRTVAV